MKSVVTLAFVVTSLFNALFAQSELQFNRVVNEIIVPSDNNNGSQENYELNAFTIPAGKVWKIESVFSREINNNDQGANSNFPGSICPEVYYRLSGTIPYALMSYRGTNVPSEILWLPEGTYDIATKCGSAADNGVISISGIEFNVVP